MTLPRFSALPDNILKRFRIQAFLIALVWAVVAVIRTLSVDSSAGDLVLTVVLWIVAVAFLVTSWLTNVEVRRRKAEQL